MNRLETMTDKLEAFMNKLSDKDVTWYPFLFLRPALYERMDTLLVAKISLLYGPPTGGVVYLFRLIRGFQFDFITALAYVIGCTLLFFVLFRLTSVIAWNRRADRIAKTKRKNI